jgi:hypothetical protein
MYDYYRLLHIILQSKIFIILLHLKSIVICATEGKARIPNDVGGGSGPRILTNGVAEG